MRKAVGQKWKEHDLIFTTRKEGKIHYHNLLGDYKNVLRKANLPEIRFHDLRNTAASLMLNLGIPVILDSRRLGHAQLSITLDGYGHLIPAMQNKAAQLIDNLVTPVKIDIVAPGCANYEEGKVICFCFLHNHRRLALSNLFRLEQRWITFFHIAGSVYAPRPG